MEMGLDIYQIILSRILRIRGKWEGDEDRHQPGSQMKQFKCHLAIRTVLESSGSSSRTSTCGLNWFSHPIFRSWMWSAFTHFHLNKIHYHSNTYILNNRDLWPLRSNGWDYCDHYKTRKGNIHIYIWDTRDETQETRNIKLHSIPKYILNAKRAS